LAKDCRSLARFTLKVPSAPAGLPRIEVKFLIDASGILQVAAKDVRTGEQHLIEVQPSYGISDLEIERMLEESIEYAEQDFAERQAIEARTEAESILTATAKALDREQAAALSGEERAKIDASVASLREAAAGQEAGLVGRQLLQHRAQQLLDRVVAEERREQHAHRRQRGHLVGGGLRHAVGDQAAGQRAGQAGRHAPPQGRP